MVKGNLAETRVITSRLLKKVKALYGIEPPLLDEKGFLDNLAACSKDLAAGCKEVSSSSGDLVAQPGRAKELLESENDKSPRWASIPQPKVSVLPPTTTEGAERIMSAAELLNPAKQYVIEAPHTKRIIICAGAASKKSAELAPCPIS